MARKASKKIQPAKKAKVAKPKAAKAKPKAAKPKTVKKKKKKSKSTKAHYVNSREFYEQICEYYKTDVIQDVLADSLNKIATGLSYAPNFINYSYKDEMVGDAILKMFSALKNKKFDIKSHSNPFSYFTTIAFHAFINRIKKEKKHRETITKYQEAMYTDEMNTGSQGTVYVDPYDATSSDD